MKKIYLLGFASMLSLAINAQTVLKVNTPLKKSKKSISSEAMLKKTGNSASHVSKNKGGNNTIAQILSTMTCNTFYTAGTPMDINLVLELTNTNPEYGDGLTITFPNSVTINSTTNTPNLGPDDGNAYSDGPEAYNGIVGQTISWGNDDNYYGGIVPSYDINGPGTYAITINITVAPGTTGPIACSYHVDGDQYVSTTNPVPASDFDGTFDIQELIPTNLTVLQTSLYNLTSSNLVTSACGLTDANLVVFAKNTGTTAIAVPTPGDVINYTVNGSPVSSPVSIAITLAGTPVNTINPGDTVAFIDMTPIDLSTPGTTYTIDGSIAFVGSGDGNATDDVLSTVTITHFTPFDATAAPYTMGFETPADDNLYANWSFPSTNQTTWDAVAGFSHTGARSLVKYGSSGDDDWGISGCIDMVGGNQYDLSFWLKYYDLASAPQMSVYYGSTADVAGMTNLLSANPMVLPADTAYYQHNYSIIPATTGTYYIGFHAVSATGSSGIMIDDINLVYNPVSIKETAASNLVSIFPNPSAGVFTVKATENNSSVSVYSIIGANVYSSTLVKGNNSIDLTNLAAGTYVVKVNNGGTLVTKRIVINK